MARFVHEIMNPELFSLQPEARAEDALEAILEFGITAVPVLDGEHRPIGVTTIRDLVRDGPLPRISTPALSVSESSSIEHAARVMADVGRHHLVVVGADGRAVGIVSSLDLLRAVMGRPPRHPAAFPHWDAELGVTWTDTGPLDAEHASAAPDGPGVLVLSAGGVRRSETDVWAEPSAALRTRVVELLEIPQRDETPALARVLTRRDLRFRCAGVSDAALRDSIARRLTARIETAPLPVGAALVETSSGVPF